MNRIFGGVSVSLSGAEYTDVVSLKPGSYLITVTPTIEGGPSATFCISKSDTRSVASIMRITNCPGVTIPVTLDLKWDAEKKLQLGKSDIIHYDGEYLVDFSLKKFSSVGKLAKTVWESRLDEIEKRLSKLENIDKETLDLQWREDANVQLKMSGPGQDNEPKVESNAAPQRRGWFWW